MRSNYLLSLLFLATSSFARSEPKSVFAHFLVGNAAGMTSAQWDYDIAEAQKAHIDGFALNIGPQDGYTDQVLQRAYHAAETAGNFSLFLSFDYASAGPWPVDRVITTINRYKNSPAQFYYKGMPLVSTFEGPVSAGDWPTIKAATGCSVVPSWTSLGPFGIANHLDKIDGAFSWDAWPIGARDMGVDSDKAWIKSLAGKPYMMPVSPWFYTNLPQWGKNWLWRGDDLWHQRWQQVMELQPDLVQIISWNDYGETHYIGPIYEDGIPDGASRYVSNHPHDAWRLLLPHYIAAYKSGNGGHFRGMRSRASAVRRTKSADDPEDKIVYWYRSNPNTSGSSGGTTGNNPDMGQPILAPGYVSQDRVFATMFVAAPSDIKIQIGSAPPTVFRARRPGLNHYSVPFDGQTGPVRFAIERNDQEITTAVGRAITDYCQEGNVDWNAVVGSSHGLSDQRSLEHSG